MKVVLIVLDSVGIGFAPDAEAYGDAGSATLQHLAEAVGGIHVPTFQRLGLGNAAAVLGDEAAIPGVEAVADPEASFGVMQEVSQGKDTITGHWEIAGLEMNPGFHVFPAAPPSFPDELVREFEAKTGRKLIGNKAASGTEIIEELGEQQTAEGSWIAYTSADSVFQIAANIDVIPLEELYRACEVARTLCNPLMIGRVIARPFRGTSAKNFKRTEDRKDYAIPVDEHTLLEKLEAADIPVYAVGKIEDIFAHRGITESHHTGNNLTSQEATLRFYREKEHGLIFANFIDFDMLYGHRRDPKGYATCLEQSDQYFSEFLPQVEDGDMVIITADHGNDPTFPGTDHTREHVPLLVYRPGHAGRDLGVRHGYFDIAQSLASLFGIEAMTRGTSFL